MSKSSRLAWGFFRTITEDYRFGCKGESLRWPLTRLGPSYAPHLYGLAWADCKVFERPTKREAARDGRQKYKWHGHPVRIRILAEVVK